MLSYLKTLSLGRGAWTLLLVSATALEATALYFQHGMGLAPCAMCIYERLALLAILIAGIIGVIAPRFFLTRWLAIIIGLFGAVKGVLLAIEHTHYQLNPAPWNVCEPLTFPQTLPLNKWFPNLFEATGSCSDISWQLFGLSMPQWLIAIFAVYAVLLALVAISQFKRVKPASRKLFY